MDLGYDVMEVFVPATQFRNQYIQLMKTSVPSTSGPSTSPCRHLKFEVHNAMVSFWEICLLFSFSLLSDIFCLEWKF